MNQLKPILKSFGLLLLVIVAVIFIQPTMSSGGARPTGKWKLSILFGNNLRVPLKADYKEGDDLTMYLRKAESKELEKAAKTAWKWQKKEGFNAPGFRPVKQESEDELMVYSLLNGKKEIGYWYNDVYHAIGHFTVNAEGEVIEFITGPHCPLLDKAAREILRDTKQQIKNTKDAEVSTLNDFEMPSLFDFDPENIFCIKQENGWYQIVLSFGPVFSVPIGWVQMNNGKINSVKSAPFHYISENDLKAYVQKKGLPHIITREDL